MSLNLVTANASIHPHAGKKKIAHLNYTLGKPHLVTSSDQLEIFLQSETLNELESHYLIVKTRQLAIIMHPKVVNPLAWLFPKF